MWWSLVRCEQLHAVHIHLFDYIYLTFLLRKEGFFLSSFPFFPPLPSSFSHGSFLLPSNLPLSLLNVLFVWVENRAVIRLGWPSNIYIMWCFGVQKGERQRRKTQTERERDAYKRNKDRCGKTREKQRKKEDRQWGSPTKKEADRVKLREDTHRQTKRV